MSDKKTAKTNKMLDTLAHARRAGVPLVAIRTADQQAASAMIIRASQNEKYPVLQWTASDGLIPSYGVDGKILPLCKDALKTMEASQGGEDFETAMMKAQKLPSYGILLAHNAHRQLTSSGDLRSTAMAVQAVASLRDKFSLDHRTLILLAPHFVAPQELEHDIVVIDDPLPDGEQLGETILSIWPDQLAKPTAEVLDKAVEAVSGVSRFAAEQLTAMSLRASGLDLDALWERKRITIEQTRGMKVWRGKDSFADLVGLSNVKGRLLNKLKARTPVGCVVFLDEIDKVLANVEHDTSGVRMDQFRTLLTEMEDNEWRGICCVGVAGSGKSAIAKAFGNEANVPTIKLDLGDMEGPHVGESEAMIRNAMNVIKAVGRGQAYFIATSNNMSVMRPELQRRFTDGFFFFDMMTKEERLAAWTHYMAKYELPAQPIPDDDGWTGAEIRNCCREAWDSNRTLAEAAVYVLPMATSRATDIEILRKSANGKFLNANAPGTYLYNPEPMAKQVRAIALTPDTMDLITDIPNAKMN